MRGSGSPPRDGKKGGCTPHQPLFSWLSRANSQMLGMAASVIYFCPPEALCRQWWHLHPRAPAGGQAPERHLTPPPKHAPAHPLIFPPVQKTWIRGPDPGSAPTLPGLGDIPSLPWVLAGEATSSAVLLCFMDGLLVFLCLPAE